MRITLTATCLLALVDTIEGNNNELANVEVKSAGEMEHVERFVDVSGLSEIVIPELYHPSGSPTVTQTTTPSSIPSNLPTVSPTPYPTKLPTLSPSSNPSDIASSIPTNSATFVPSSSPTVNPTAFPTKDPTRSPTDHPTIIPTIKDSSKPTENSEIFNSVQVITVDVSNTAPHNSSGGNREVLMDSMTKQVFEDVLLESLSDEVEKKNQEAETVDFELFSVEVIDQWFSKVNNGRVNEILNVKFLVVGQKTPRNSYLTLSFEEYIYNGFMVNVDLFYDRLSQATPFFQLLAYSRLSDEGTTNSNGEGGSSTSLLVIGILLSIAIIVVGAAFIYRKRKGYPVQNAISKETIPKNDTHDDSTTGQSIPPSWFRNVKSSFQDQTNKSRVLSGASNQSEGDESSVTHIVKSDEESLSFGLLNFFNCSGPSAIISKKPSSIQVSKPGIMSILSPISEEAHRSNEKSKGNNGSITNEAYASKIDIVDSRMTQSIRSSVVSGYDSSYQSSYQSSNLSSQPYTDASERVDFTQKSSIDSESAESSYQSYNRQQLRKNVATTLLTLVPTQDSASIPTISEMSNDTNIYRRRRKEELYRLTDGISF